MATKKNQPRSSKKWVNVGEGVQGIGGGWHSRRRFTQKPQGKSGPPIRKPPPATKEPDGA